MNKHLLHRYMLFLQYMGIDIDEDTLPLTNGGNSVVCNNDTKFKECLGMSVNEVTRIVAKELGKEVKWIE